MGLVLAKPAAAANAVGTEHPITDAPHGHILTNVGVWSPDGRWIVYDVRSDAAGEKFDGARIEAVNVETREVRVLYESRNGAHCGVATFHPSLWQVVFIHGPERPTPDWSYGAFHRQGVLVDWERPGVNRPLDARDLVPPFTAGALRGGSHVHVFNAAGDRVSFTYEDHVLATAAGATGAERNLRNVGVSVVGHPVAVNPGHPRNHSGTAFTVLVTQTTDDPRPGSDEIQKAFEEGWIGTEGYRRPDGTRQRYALAFQGHVRGMRGETNAEVFVVDLPDDLTVAGDVPLQGSALRRPGVPRGVVQRRLTHTADRKHPGLQGPRHWLRSAPDGSSLGFLMKDDEGVAQLWTVSPNGGAPRQITRSHEGVASAFTWSPDGRRVAHVMGGSVCVTSVADGTTRALTGRVEGEGAPRPEACVFSPTGDRIAYVSRTPDGTGQMHNQIYVVPAN
ncbi:MAG: DUF3748 domain-containing protein [Verrucomicrobiales bacterium]|nr:DUF3748 domain-containing protein [Verrucomicrobiales bacterium]